MSTLISRKRALDDGRVETYTPSPDADGLFELGDPRRGKEMHHKKNAIFVETLDMALHLVREHEFSLRMKGDITGQRNLISAKEIQGL